MITKFEYIKNTGVFKNFTWQESFEEVDYFNKLNIFYGQNYSGKTTLSKIFRSLEIGSFSKNYENAEFKICIENNLDCSQNSLQNHNKVIRVFNEDFINDNLKFIIDSEEMIKPFAILGEKNNEIEKEIEILQKTLGVKKEKNSSGLYAILESYKQQQSFYKKDLDNLQKTTNKKLAEKATGKEFGIKYNKKYHQINYDISKLKLDLERVEENNYKKLNNDEKFNFEDLLVEKIKNQIKEIIPPNIDFNNIQEKVSQIVTKIVSKSDKIDELINDAVLNRWVKEGKNLHEPNTICKFCTGIVSENRWLQLEKHFDEEFRNLEIEISQLINKIEKEDLKFKNFVFYKKEDFYVKYYQKFDDLEIQLKKHINNYIVILKKFRSYAINRQKDILNAQDYNYESDLSIQLKYFFKEFNELRILNNSYSKNLIEDQDSAREKLRLHEIYEFSVQNNLNESFVQIKYLQDQLFDIERDEYSVEREIDLTIEKIFINKKSQTDESKGADKINDFLKNHFGHAQLSLQSLEHEDFIGIKTMHFEVQRDGIKAFNLSEGERSLIAFCYFVAKLEDFETKGLKPIIWIDDPISSLDGNHIFFIYSLIKSKIYDYKDFEQLFISTHNLNFLKYLKRLPNKKDRDNKAVKYFLIERIDNFSSILEMPKYLQEHVTEFNHLFKSIYCCATIKSVNDSNYTLFYNFGNNARKFLEIYLYYKYPNFENDESKYKKFFGADEIPLILTNRLINEYSHLCGVVERGEMPVEIPEMKKTAEMICKKLEEKDKEQFEALVKSLK